MYEIQSKSDFQSGATLTVRIPEEELDKKALYTILAEQPEFLLPFRHIIVDGQIEFTFQVGNRSKLTYLSGNKSPAEYADLWFRILHPLLNCDDWFMDPYSFVLKPEYLYCDTADKSIYFVYIPSKRACSDYEELKGMVTEVAKQNHVTDVTLENKVVWALQDFSLAEFLQMLRPYRGYAAQDGAPGGGAPVPQYQQAPAAAPPPPPQYAAPVQQPAAQPLQAQQPAQPAPKKFGRKQEPAQPVQTPAPQPAPPPMPSGRPDDISIDIPFDGKERKKEKAQKEPAPKKEKEPKEKSGFLGRKQQPQQEIMQGAAAQSQQYATPSQQAPNVAPQYQQAPPVYSAPSPQTYAPQPGGYDDGATQIDLREAAGGPRFRYVGNGTHPGLIQVPAAGGIFSIGRYDPSAGPGQNSFEFEKDTKAVSRRHAVIERNAEGFVLVDLNSSAGTFVNGQKMTPNTPYKLEKGCRVSFGYSGADYIWEE